VYIKLFEQFVKVPVANIRVFEWCVYVDFVFSDTFTSFPVAKRHHFRPAFRLSLSLFLTLLAFTFVTKLFEPDFLGIGSLPYGL